jgi:hypothetical protein
VGGDGVKFLIDLDSRTSGATAADSALSRVEDAAGRADRHLQNMGGHARGLTQDVFKAEFAMKVLEKGAEMAWEGVRKVGELIKDTVAVAGEERREKMALTNLLGGREEAEAALHYLDPYGFLAGLDQLFQHQSAIPRLGTVQRDGARHLVNAGSLG